MHPESPCSFPLSSSTRRPPRHFQIAHALAVVLLALAVAQAPDARAQAAAKKLPPELEANLTAVCGRTDAYDCYTNHKYGYVIAWPVKYLVPQGEADDGGGQYFTSKDGRAKLACWAVFNNVAGQTLQKAFQEALKESGTEPSYKHLGKDFFVVSGLKDGRIYYRKTVSGGRVQATFELTYDQALKAEFNPIAADLARSFTVHPSFSW